MILEAVLLAQLTGTMRECATDATSTSGIKYYSTDCPAIGGLSITNGTTGITAGPTCPDGYTLMADVMMQPKCARDIIDPVFK